MSKAVLLSVRPEWAEKIASGKKTIEVRKTRPKLETPFRAYLYVTAGNLSYRCPNGMICHCTGGRAVIGEFVCDYIVEAWWDYVPDAITREVTGGNLEALTGLCMTDTELFAYTGDSMRGHVYGWHISNLRIYDKPRELTEFRRVCPNDLYCETCAMCVKNNGTCGNESLHIKRPPQSWCYVEEVQ